MLRTFLSKMSVVRGWLPAYVLSVMPVGWRRASLPQSSTKHAGDESHGPDLGHVPFFNQSQWPWWWKHVDWLGLDHMIFLHWNEDIGKSFMQAMWTKIGAQADSLRRPATCFRLHLPSHFNQSSTPRALVSCLSSLRPRHMPPHASPNWNAWVPPSVHPNSFL